MIIYRGVTKNGMAYAIDDDCMAPRGSNEECEIIKEQLRIANEIMNKYTDKEKSA